MFFENFSAVGDRIANALGKSVKIVAALLAAELGMVDRTHEEVGPFPEIERALILNVGDSLDRHSAKPVHAQIARAEDMLSVEAEP